MTQLSFFQIYSQKENHASNNALLLLSHLYQHEVSKLNHVISELLEEHVEFGPRFELQRSGSDSVPDAIISQRALRIYVEAKLGNQLTEAQIEAHLNSINNERTKGEQSFLLVLARDPLPTSMLAKAMGFGKSHGIPIAATTFSGLARSARTACGTHEENILRVIDDFERFLKREKIDERGDEIQVVPVGTSFDENVRFGMYFEPSARATKADRRYLGLYKSKAVRAIGEVVSVSIRHSNGEIESELGTRISADSIDEMIAACNYYPDLKEEDLRFYRVGKFEETEFAKSSSGGIWGPRVFLVKDLLDSTDKPIHSILDLAQMLRTKRFE